MDLRITKTRNAIRNAFLELRVKKPLEKITVKELSAAANINKATFYLHYHDIYDLSEALEREVIENCLNSVSDPKTITSDVSSFVKSLSESMTANEKLIKILFEGTRNNSFTKLFEEGIYKLLTDASPDYKPTLESRMRATFLIEGAYHTFFRYSEYGIDKVLELIENLSEGKIKLTK